MYACLYLSMYLCVCVQAVIHAQAHSCHSTPLSVYLLSLVATSHVLTVVNFLLIEASLNFSHFFISLPCVWSSPKKVSK